MHKEMKQGAIIYWEDAAIHNQSEQLSESEVKKYEIIQCISVGIIVHETPIMITLAVDWFPSNQPSEVMQFRENQFRQISSILKSGIKKIKRFKIDAKR